MTPVGFRMVSSLWINGITSQRLTPPPNTLPERLSCTSLNKTDGNVKPKHQHHY